jgi:hypothetical protein
MSYAAWVVASALALFSDATPAPGHGTLQPLGCPSLSPPPAIELGRGVRVVAFELQGRCRLEFPGLGGPLPPPRDLAAEPSPAPRRRPRAAEP